MKSASLVETLVAMTILSVVIALMSYLFVNSAKSIISSDKLYSIFELYSYLDTANIYSDIDSINLNNNLHYISSSIVQHPDFEEVKIVEVHLHFQDNKEYRYHLLIINND